MSARRVVVTGVGAVTPCGNDAAATWAALLGGRSGIGPVTRFDAAALAVRIAGEVKGFALDAAAESKDIRRTSLMTRYAINAALEAVRSAQLDLTAIDRERFGVVVGTGAGGLDLIFENHTALLDRGPRRVAPTLIAHMIPDAAAGAIAILLGAQGPNMAVTAACSTGGHSIGEAWETIRRGDADLMLAGGAEAPIHPTILASFANMRGLASDNERPDAACKPFDARRDGFVLAEGAGVLAIEALDHALLRGAPILAELVGYGNTCDAGDMVAADEQGRGVARAIAIALRKAELAPAAIGYINAHGTGTPLNDAAETAAFKRALGDHARQVAISSTKSMLGHMQGAAGAVEAIVCVLALRDGRVPPTINLHEPDPACDLDYVPLVARELALDTVLSTSVGLGGHNSALIFRRYHP